MRENGNSQNFSSGQISYCCVYIIRICTYSRVCIYVCVCNFYLISFLEILINLNLLISLTLIRKRLVKRLLKRSVRARGLSERLIYYITIQENYHAKKIKLTF